MLRRGRRLLMNGVMDLPRLRFVDGKNVDEVLDRGVAQAFQIREARFHERQRLLFGNGQGGGEGLGGLRHLLLDRVRRRRVAIDVDFPAGQSRGQARVLPFLSDRERELIFIDGNLDALFRYRRRGS